MKHMNEKSLNQRLRKGILICLIAGAFILIACISILGILQHSLNNIIADQMKDNTNEYVRRISRQMDKEFEALDSLAVALDYRGVFDEKWLTWCLYEINQKNSFVTMAYFRPDGTGIMVYSGYDIKRIINSSEMNEPARKAIEESFQGKRVISKLYDSTVSSDMIFTYSIPIFEGNDVKGVLSAGSNIDTFQEIMDDESNQEGAQAVYLVNAKTDVLLSTKKTREKLPKDIFHATGFSQENEEQIRRALVKGESIFTESTQNGKKYYVYFNPVGINDWYVMYVDSQQGVNEVAYQIVNIMGITFVLLFAVILLLLIQTCRMMLSNNRELMSLAYKDRLTGADNIARFNLYLDKAKNAENGFCIVAMNIHQFKYINEIFGEKAGDRLLRNISRMIARSLTEEEFFCRESGDQFYIYLNNSHAEQIRLRMKALVSDICSIRLSRQSDYQILLYVGAVIWPPESVDKKLSNEMMITRTRFAMQSGKKLPANQIHFFDADLHKSEEISNYVEAHMHQALQKGEFKLYLQPKIILADQSLGGAEALVRWITDTGRIIYPNDFIPQFERNGFCVQLDMYMVEQACMQIREWIDAGIKPIPISVNQSKLLFYDSDYIDNMKQILNRYGIPANLITLEILEGLALDHAEEINDKLRQLRQLGFKISMDDFGSGYSSFNTLGNLEIDELKLDRSFLLEATEAKESRFCTIMEHIINLTKSLNITTVAEGVETLENENLIRKVGCDIGQGYLYSRPISASDFNKQYMGME